MYAKMPPPVLSIVVPCYNEQEVLPISIPELCGVIRKMAEVGLVAQESYILCVDDGSRDRTWQLLCEMHNANPMVKAVKLAHNRGHQFALLAGLMEVKDHCDISVSIDADLQDDTSAIIDMVKAYHEGSEIVYGVRSSRDTDTWFKRTSAHAFYRLQHAMGLKTVYDHADFRLMSNRALEILSQYGEENLFLRGIVAQIGLKTEVVKYARKSRTAGESKYPLTKMLAFSIDGITSFSVKPIKMIFFFGAVFLVIDILMAVYVFVSYFCGNVIPGWTSLMLSIWFLGSLILIGIGVIGEYIGKIYIEVKRRPRFNIEERRID